MHEDDHQSSRPCLESQTVSQQRKDSTALSIFKTRCTLVVCCSDTAVSRVWPHIFPPAPPPPAQ